MCFIVTMSSSTDTLLWCFTAFSCDIPETINNGFSPNGRLTIVGKIFKMIVVVVVISEAEIVERERERDRELGRESSREGDS